MFRGDLERVHAGLLAKLQVDAQLLQVSVTVAGLSALADCAALGCCWPVVSARNEHGLISVEPVESCEPSEPVEPGESCEAQE
jgi:hypothetical protein